MDALVSYVFPHAQLDRDFEEEREGKPPHPLDKEYGIDFQIRLSSGLIHTVQRKILIIDNKHYQQMTLEYENNPDTGEMGDYFKLDANFYFFGYTDGNYEQDPTKLVQWNVYCVDCLKEWIDGIGGDTGLIKRGWLRNNHPPISHSSFFAIPFNAIPKRCVHHAYDEPEGTKHGQTHLSFLNYPKATKPILRSY